MPRSQQPALVAIEAPRLPWEHSGTWSAGEGGSAAPLPRPQLKECMERLQSSLGLGLHSAKSSCKASPWALAQTPWGLQSAEQSCRRQL